jgi:hypothetical protein
VGLALTTLGIFVVGIYPDPFVRMATDSIQMLAAIF